MRDTNAFKEAMSRCAATTWIVAAAEGSIVAGMTATAVMSLTADPPRVAVALNRSSMSHTVITLSRRFTLNLISEHQSEIALVFAGKDPSIGGPEKFKYGAWLFKNGIPHLANSLAILVCRVEQENAVGTHTLFVASVDETILDADGGPAIYYRRSFSRIADARKTVR